MCSKTLKECTSNATPAEQKFSTHRQSLNVCVETLLASAKSRRAFEPNAKTSNANMRDGDASSTTRG